MNAPIMDRPIGNSPATNPPTANAPTGVELRKLAKAASRARQTGHWYQLIEELYILIFTLIVLISMMIPALSDSSSGVWGEAITGWNGSDFAQQRAQLTWLMWAALSALGVWVSVRIGPLTATAGMATWLLPTPADRRGLLWARIIPVMLVATAWGLISGALSGALALNSNGLGSHGLSSHDLGSHGLGVGDLGWWCAMAGAFQFLLTATVFAAQPESNPQLRRPIDIAMVFAPVVVGAGFALLAPAIIFDAATHATLLAATLVVVALAAGGLSLWGITRIDLIPTTQLRRGGALLATSTAAISDLNIRNLMSLLAHSGGDTSWWQKLALHKKVQWRLVRGPASATICSDAVIMMRNLRHIMQFVATLAGVWLICFAGLSKPLVAISVILLGFIAALATTGAARHADDSPAWDRYFPAAAKDTRSHRMHFPLLMMFIWWIGATTAFVLSSGDNIWWITAALAAPVSASAALRSAFRPAPDWDAPLIPTPMGAFPTSLFSGLAHGFDLLIIGSVPLVLAILGVIELDVTRPIWLWLQAMLTILVAGWAMHTSKPKP